MNGMLHDYMGLKDFSSFNELVEALRRNRFDIPSGTILDAPEESGQILKRMEEVAFIMIYNALPPSERETADMHAILEQSHVLGSNIYAFFTMPNPKPLHLITQEASQLIASTRLTERIGRSFCDEYLKTPYFIHSGDDRALFEDVNAIALYVGDVGQLTCHIGLMNGGQFARNVNPEDESMTITNEIAADEYGEDYILLNGAEINSDIRTKLARAATYIIKFILLINAEKQPLLVESQYKKKGGTSQKAKETEKRLFGNLSYKKVSLTYEYKRKVSKEFSECRVFDKEGKTLRATKVTGHIRMQAYGPGWSLHRPIYIDEHESKAWKKDGIQLIKVVK